MSEKPPAPESAPAADPYQAFETLVEEGVWSAETVDKLNELFESHEEDLYMIYLNYQESGLVAELSGYEQQLFDWLKEVFEERPE